MKIFKKVLIEGDLNISRATLLTIKEAEKLPAHLRVYENWWWLRSPGRDPGCVAYVLADGCVDPEGSPTSDDEGSVRPVLIIENLKKSNLKIGDRFVFDDIEFEVISDNSAFCVTDIAEHYFRRNWSAADAIDYEKSNIKACVDLWFKNATKKAS